MTAASSHDSGDDGKRQYVTSAVRSTTLYKNRHQTAGLRKLTRMTRVLLTRNWTDIDNDVTAAAGFPNNPRVFDVDFVANISSSSATARDVIIETASLRLLTFSLRAPADVSARACDVAAPLASSLVDQTLCCMRRLLVAPVAAAGIAELSLTVVSMTLLSMTLCDVIVRLEVDSLM